MKKHDEWFSVDEINTFDEFQKFDAKEFFKVTEIKQSKEVEKIEECLSVEPERRNVSEKENTKSRNEDLKNTDNKLNDEAKISESLKREKEELEQLSQNLEDGLQEAVKNTATNTSNIAAQASANVGTIATTVGATTVGASVAMAIISTVLSADPTATITILDKGLDFVSFQVEVEKLSEDNVYYVELSNGVKYRLDIPTVGTYNGIVDGLSSFSEYDIKLVGENGEIGGTTTYCKKTFYTLRKQDPTATISITPYNSNSLQYEIYVSDPDDSGSDYRLEVLSDGNLYTTDSNFEEKRLTGSLYDLESSTYTFNVYATVYSEEVLFKTYSITAPLDVKGLQMTNVVTNYNGNDIITTGDISDATIKELTYEINYYKDDNSCVTAKDVLKLNNGKIDLTIKPIEDAYNYEILFYYKNKLIYKSDKKEISRLEISNTSSLLALNYFAFTTKFENARATEAIFEFDVYNGKTVETKRITSQIVNDMISVEIPITTISDYAYRVIVKDKVVLEKSKQAYEIASQSNALSNLTLQKNVIDDYYYNAVLSNLVSSNTFEIKMTNDFDSTEVLQQIRDGKYTFNSLELGKTYSFKAYEYTTYNQKKYLLSETVLQTTSFVAIPDVVISNTSELLTLDDYLFTTKIEHPRATEVTFEFDVYNTEFVETKKVTAPIVNDYINVEIPVTTITDYAYRIYINDKKVSEKAKTAYEIISTSSRLNDVTVAKTIGSNNKYSVEISNLVSSNTYEIKMTNDSNSTEVIKQIADGKYTFDSLEFGITYSFKAYEYITYNQKQYLLSETTFTTSNLDIPKLEITNVEYGVTYARIYYTITGDNAYATIDVNGELYEDLNESSYITYSPSDGETLVVNGTINQTYEGVTGKYSKSITPVNYTADLVQEVNEPSIVMGTEECFVSGTITNPKISKMTVTINRSITDIPFEPETFEVDIINGSYSFKFNKLTCDSVKLTYTSGDDELFENTYSYQVTDSPNTYTVGYPANTRQGFYDEKITIHLENDQTTIADNYKVIVGVYDQDSNLLDSTTYTGQQEIEFVGLDVVSKYTVIVKEYYVSSLGDILIKENNIHEFTITQPKLTLSSVTYTDSKAVINYAITNVNASNTYSFKLNINGEMVNIESNSTSFEYPVSPSTTNLVVKYECEVSYLMIDNTYTTKEDLYNGAVVLKEASISNVSYYIGENQILITGDITDYTYANLSCEYKYYYELLEPSEGITDLTINDGKFTILLNSPNVMSFSFVIKNNADEIYSQPTVEAFPIMDTELDEQALEASSFTFNEDKANISLTYTALYGENEYADIKLYGDNTLIGTVEYHDQNTVTFENVGIYSSYYIKYVFYKKVNGTSIKVSESDTAAFNLAKPSVEASYYLSSSYDLMIKSTGVESPETISSLAIWAHVKHNDDSITKIELESVDTGYQITLLSGETRVNVDIVAYVTTTSGLSYHIVVDTIVAKREEIKVTGYGKDGSYPIVYAAEYYDKVEAYDSTDTQINNVYISGYGITIQNSDLNNVKIIGKKYIGSSLEIVTLETIVNYDYSSVETPSFVAWCPNPSDYEVSYANGKATLEANMNFSSEDPDVYYIVELTSTQTQISTEYKFKTVNFTIEIETDTVQSYAVRYYVCKDDANGNRFVYEDTYPSGSVEVSGYTKPEIVNTEYDSENKQFKVRLRDVKELGGYHVNYYANTSNASVDLNDSNFTNKTTSIEHDGDDVILVFENIESTELYFNFELSLEFRDDSDSYCGISNEYVAFTIDRDGNPCQITYGMS